MIRFLGNRTMPSPWISGQVKFFFQKEGKVFLEVRLSIKGGNEPADHFSPNKLFRS